MKFRYEDFELSQDAFRALFNGIVHIAVTHAGYEVVKMEMEKFGIKVKVTE